jgi:hypothetical protein
MTKVQVTIPLSRPLNEKDYESISHMHSVYGIFAARLAPVGDALFVEYDASRMSREEVRETLAENGLPISLGLFEPGPSEHAIPG